MESPLLRNQTLKPNDTPSTPESEKLIKEVINKYEKCRKAMAVNRKLFEEYYKAEVEGHKKILFVMRNARMLMVKV